MVVYSDELYHYGVKGMKWGQHLFDKASQIRHKMRSRIMPRPSDFHNKNGTRTELGKESYFVDKRDYSRIQDAAKEMRESGNSAQRREQYHKMVSDLIAQGGSDRTLRYSKYKKKIEEGRSIVAKTLAETAYQGYSYDETNDIIQYIAKHRERSRTGTMIKANYKKG